MKICFIPIDNRPVCYNLAKDICAIDEDLELLIPPREFLGTLGVNAKVDEIFRWLEGLQDFDCIILSLDTLAYGGLIPSRRSPDTFDEIKARVERLKPILKGKKVYAFSSIMRISNNNYNEEEKEYWSKYGKKIFEYSYNLHKNGTAQTEVPDEILEDYINTRNRNFEINKLYLEWQKEGLFDTLIFSKDDCAEFGFNVIEAQELERLGGKTKTGADEIPLSLLSRAIEKEIKVFVEFIEPDWKGTISNYEDVSIEKSVKGQLELGGFTQVAIKEEADIVLIVNNFIEKQGEHVMGWETQGLNKICQLPPPRGRGGERGQSLPYIVADVRYANGADNDFVEQLLPQIDLENFYGYAGWNTSANTLGSLLAGVKVKWKAKKYNDLAFRKLQTIRFLDDWAYQANVREQISEPCDIKDLMKPYEDRIAKVFGYVTNQPNPIYSYPWNRMFEVEVSL